jgi:hypothetical protein
MEEADHSLLLEAAATGPDPGGSEKKIRRRRVVVYSLTLVVLTMPRPSKYSKYFFYQVC